MRQLDLFGSFFETPAKEEKTEDIQTDLKKDVIPAVIVNKETPSFLVDIAEEMPETDASKVSVEIAENTAQMPEAEENLEFSPPFPLIENIDSEINPSPAIIEEPIVDLPVDKADVGPTISSQQKELKTDQFDENEEVEFQEENSAVHVENEPALIAADTKVNVKKQLQKRGRKSLEHIEAEVDLIEVPEDEMLFKKQYYPISEVARWFRVNASLLRFWEKEFDILRPKKNGKGDRLFRPEDVKNLQLIYQLLRQRKYTIEGAREYLKTNRKKADVEMQLANSLQKFKSFLLDLKANL